MYQSKSHYPSLAHFLTTKEMRTLSAAVLFAAVLCTGCKSTPSGQGPGATRTKEPAIRINAGASEAYTDPSGNAWLPDQGFTGGRSVVRGDIAIAGTQTPEIYRTEHYGMSAFSQAVPNGDYVVRLHFAETYSGVTEKGQRIFTVKVEDKEIKDLDVLARAGASQKAWIETLAVTVTDGKLDIAFTPGVQNPEINGIEINPK